ncbi:C4-dicarboxylate ABC transporter substrate-binding protein [Mesorhizobium sp. NBSH29]|uniref:TRAP transporter substrate-binding protein n=1 Tax=Mesorhizobium sp. NBSH29 TaxID=2654249 RepID=UPI001896529F|nr:TRAP transporter substrate-binding protein [Mesorhizobium sp. NBSH29]QPC85355.1 C4-dicarboxylate ABC transporter substrate-binding protein [Mesorhizobium sp. NBSH29]
MFSGKLSAAFAAAAIMCVATFAEATELKLASFVPPQHPMDRGAITPMVNAFNAGTNGTSTIKIYPSGELGAGPVQQYKRAVTGIADIVFGIPEYTPEQFPRTTLMNLPGLFETPEAGTKALWDSYDLFAPDFAQVKMLAFWTNSPAILITRNKPVRSIADLAGLKIRVPDPAAAKMAEAWGAVPVSIPTTEAYNAMSTGVVDAVWIGPSGIGSYKLHEVGKYLTTNLPSPLATFYLAMNKDSWAALTPEEQATLDKASGRDLSMAAADAFEKAGDEGFDLARKAGIEFITLDEESATELRDKSNPILEELANEASSKGGFDAKAILSTVSSH